MSRYRKPYRIRKKKSIFKNRFFWISIFILMVLGGIFYLLFFSEVFQIKKVIITGEEKVSKDDIETVIGSELEQKILLFKTKNIFLINSKKIKENILNTFPQIGEVKIKREFPATLNLLITERKEVGIFCRDTTCFLLDKEGVIFENVSEETPLLKIQDSNLNLDKEIKTGEKILEKEILSPILETETNLRENLKIPIKEILIVSQERVNFKTFEDWEIYFNPQEDMNWQLTKLKAVLENEIPAEKRKDLEYIELRFGNFANPKSLD